MVKHRLYTDKRYDHRNNAPNAHMIKKQLDVPHGAAHCNLLEWQKLVTFAV